MPRGLCAGGPEMFAKAGQGLVLGAADGLLIHADEPGRLGHGHVLLEQKPQHKPLPGGQELQRYRGWN